MAETSPAELTSSPELVNSVGLVLFASSESSNLERRNATFEVAYLRFLGGIPLPEA